MRTTPPLWLRHATPWRLLKWWDSRQPTCWTGMAMWKMGHEGRSWWPGRTCWDGPKGQEFDYCCKYKTEAEFRKALTGLPWEECLR